MASGRMSITFSTSDDETPRIVTERLCELCGEWKNMAFDVCWQPDVPCNRDQFDEGSR